jgi:hypothetical protein
MPVNAGLDGRWANLGSIFFLIGGVLAAIGLYLQAVYWYNLSPTTPISSVQGTMEASWVLLGTGVLVSAIGWFLHQLAVFRALRRAYGQY